jgi:N-terminal acetyltransferase B complex non-catalytic subunit
MVSFASDVKEFLKHIHGAQKLWLAKALHQACPELTPAISPVKALRYRVSAFQVEYQLGVQAHVTDSDVVAQAVEIMHLYLRSIQLSVDLDPQENMPGEELLTLITDLLIQLYLRTQQLGYILEAILVLEFGLAMRRSTHYLRLIV